MVQIIILYIICGISWAIWEIHAYFTMDEETINTLNTFTGNVKLYVVLVSSIIIGVLVVASWPIEVPVAMVKLHTRNRK